ncbi:unnamed protein product [Gordionus sp. m RMFG-2023]|uniref:adapter molecule Crk-like n=1 Tax=Gordionus sp. m RMFG-2023 TaxID=3053472 RepID=UPI0030E5DCA5
MDKFDPMDKESWYFGALKRQEAQDILERELDMGTFLIRDSATCPGDFVLCVKETKAIRHYIIKKMEAAAGNRNSIRFKIGDEIFSDVASLLRHYTTNCLDNSTLSKPAAKLKFIALYDFQGKDSEDLPFKKGHTLTGIKKNEENWWTAKNEEGACGTIPSTYIKILKSDSSTPFQNTSNNIDDSPISLSMPQPNTINSNQIHANGLFDNLKNSAENKKITSYNHNNIANGHNSNRLKDGFPKVLQNLLVPPKSLPALALVKQVRNPNAYDKTALKLRVGDIVNVTKMNMNGQWEGELNGKSGFFPFTHIQFIETNDQTNLLMTNHHHDDKLTNCLMKNGINGNKKSNGIIESTTLISSSVTSI